MKENISGKGCVYDKHGAVGDTVYVCAPLPGWFKGKQIAVMRILIPELCHDPSTHPHPPTTGPDLWPEGHTLSAETN